jgi:hypothetical protein
MKEDTCNVTDRYTDESFHAWNTNNSNCGVTGDAERRRERKSGRGGGPN